MMDDGKVVDDAKEAVTLKELAAAVQSTYPAVLEGALAANEEAIHGGCGPDGSMSRRQLKAIFGNLLLIIIPVMIGLIVFTVLIYKLS